MKAFSDRQHNAVKHLKNNTDFIEVVDYLKEDLEDLKNQMLAVHIDDFNRMQGAAMYLAKFIKDIESAFGKTDSQ